MMYIVRNNEMIREVRRDTLFLAGTLKLWHLDIANYIHAYVIKIYGEIYKHTHTHAHYIEILITTTYINIYIYMYNLIMCC